MAFDAGSALSTGATGASVGATFGPIGAAVGGVAGALVGGFMGGKKPSVTPPPAAVDPNMVALVEELSRTRDSIRSGLSTEYTQGRVLLSQAVQSQLEDAAALSGGDVGMAVAAAERASQGYAAGVSNLTSTAFTQASQYTDLITQLTKAISQRQLDVATTLWSVSRGESADFSRTTAQNRANAMTSPGIMGTLTSTAKDLISALSSGNKAPVSPVSGSVLQAASSFVSPVASSFI